MSTWYMFMLQDSNSPLMEQLTFFHDHTMMIIIMITLLVSYLLLSFFLNSFHTQMMESQMIELIWTILPAMTLIFIALPSLYLLYLLDEMNNPIITIKSIGHQWYWSYEIKNINNIEFDSYLNSELKSESFRLLDVDNRLPIPFNTLVRMMITSSDVIHSWTIPSLGVKVDATPGRINQISFLIKKAGLMYGQCSEICGMNHSFMPIVIESISPKNFIKWATS
uniref:Cytochrome c oxidase subunit 2 n=1 Tax=Eucnemidae sp. 4 ACP-2013 TaxID=1434503 RepID=A0A3G4RYA4_9COLE|nr:cytochrome c oxidase subunit 2 [Eucnemidae sp. 4 ACP-2013]